MSERPKKNLADLTQRERKLALNNNVAISVASFLIYMPEYRITQIRYRNNHKDQSNQHSKNYRAKIRKAELEKYGEPYGTYNKWTTEEEQELLHYVEQGKTHQEIAKILDRTVYSVQKKYKRLQKELGYEQ